MRYRIHQIKLDLDQGHDDFASAIRKKLKKKRLAVRNIKIVKESVDARKKPAVKLVYTLDFSCDEKLPLEEAKAADYDSQMAKTMRQYRNALKALGKSGSAKRPIRPVIAGFGPCGMFAALVLAEAGLCPVVLERGQAVDERFLAVKRFWHEGVLDTESNVQFGEGGAGTFSDGKLTTGIKDIRISKVLREFAEAGADSSILYKQKPHIGTDQLRSIVKNIRRKIESLGGEIYFNTCLTDIITEECDGAARLKGVKARRREGKPHSGGQPHGQDHRTGAAISGTNSADGSAGAGFAAQGAAALDAGAFAGDFTSDTATNANAAGVAGSPGNTAGRCSGTASSAASCCVEIDFAAGPAAAGAAGNCNGGGTANPAADSFADAADTAAAEGRISHIKTDCLILAIGHSARDTFQMLYDRGIPMEQKPFSIGVRIEHPQEMIDRVQYGDAKIAEKLGAADYKLNHRCENGRGVYTFCMCPGGSVINAASEERTAVTNGMSNSARDGKYANSGLLVDVRTADFASAHPLAGVAFQRKYERLAYENGQGRLPKTSYRGFRDDQADRVRNSLPEFAADAIIEAMPHLGRKLKGFDAEDAAMTAVETRSSSPVRIRRDETMQSEIQGVYPAGEGAGYAGGIMSAAVDGIKAAERIMAVIFS